MTELSPTARHLLRANPGMRVALVGPCSRVVETVILMTYTPVYPC